MTCSVYSKEKLFQMSSEGDRRESRVFKAVRMTAPHCLASECEALNPTAGHLIRGSMRLLLLIDRELCRRVVLATGCPCPLRGKCRLMLTRYTVVARRNLTRLATSSQWRAWRSSAVKPRSRRCLLIYTTRAVAFIQFTLLLTGQRL